ncbi:hypothetical protein GHK92_06890 [Nocardioides sp. dk4132]|uniref:hypothetical protein n=1 Tax=unclassified Nocardioides TaxID=2615069 RepID=UPI00129633D5|nr:MULTISPECIES: hypothetical protein [unclassified Nocardioides]MQW75592.1 hypothetical protein [Nocardioides sp. dk4132]QGA08497.1 hypothetical protein GFH29_14635 [Nocardioides sp. dk884]
MNTIPQSGSPIASTTDPAGVHPHADPDFDRSTDMNLMHENLARVQMSARLGEAQERRRGYQLSRAARLSRKAEHAAQQARLALARAL